MRTIKRFITIFGLTAAVAIAASAQTILTALDGTRVDVQGQKGKLVVLAVGAVVAAAVAKQAEYTNIAC